MGIHLLTGHAGAPHVTSDDQRRQNAVLHGTGAFIIDGCACTMKDATTAHVSEGLMVLNGAFVRVTSGGIDVPVPSGSLGESRTDYIVARYSVAANGVESVSVVCKKNARGSGGNILQGSTVAEFEMYSLEINGVNVGTPQQAMPTFTATAAFGLGALAMKNSLAAADLPVVPVSKGGTGATDVASALSVLGIGDHVIASGYDQLTGWDWVKLDNGLAICARSELARDYDVTVSWGPIYYRSPAILGNAYPFDFKTKPHVLPVCSSGSCFLVGAEPGTTHQSPTMWLCSPSHYSTRVDVHVFAVGRYK